MKPGFLSRDKVIVTAAITGELHGKWDHAAIPEQPEEQAAVSRDCWRAGAAVVHLHARGRDGRNTTDPKACGRMLRLVGEACPILRQVGSWCAPRLDPDGRVEGATDEERLAFLDVLPRAEMYGVGLGSLELRTKYGLCWYRNSRTLVEAYLKACRERGLAVQLEVFEAGHIREALELAEMDLLPPPLRFTLVLGRPGGAPAEPAALGGMIALLPEGAVWEVAAVGEAHLRVMGTVMCLGGNVRIGLEDALHCGPGGPAEGNVNLVERVVRMAEAIGREPATVEEATVALGLEEADGGAAGDGRRGGSAGGGAAGRLGGRRAAAWQLDLTEGSVGT